MKKIIMGLKDNRQIYAFAVIGLILIIFPNEMGIAAPYVIGALMLIYGGLNIFISLKYPDSSMSLGNGVISVVIGGILLVQRENAISIIGVIWAMISLYEAAREIDEYRRSKNIRIINIVSIIVTGVLAILLMVDPFAHFYAHVRILGLEIIVYTIAKGMAEWKNKKGKSEKT